MLAGIIMSITTNAIINKTEKGFYNATDLNRVEEWCEYLANTLTSYSYPVTIKVKKDWHISDFPNEVEVERIRRNVNALKQAYYSFTQIPENLEYMTWKKANSIEKILNEIDTLINNMIASFYYSGEIYAGEV